MLEFDVAKKEYYSVAPSTDYSEAPHGDLPSDSDEVKIKCHIAYVYDTTILWFCIRRLYLLSVRETFRKLK